MSYQEPDDSSERIRQERMERCRRAAREIPLTECERKVLDAVTNSVTDDEFWKKQGKGRPVLWGKPKTKIPDRVNELRTAVQSGTDREKLDKIISITQEKKGDLTKELNAQLRLYQAIREAHRVGVINTSEDLTIKIHNGLEQKEIDIQQIRLRDSKGSIDVTEEFVQDTEKEAVNSRKKEVSNDLMQQSTTLGQMLATLLHSIPVPRTPARKAGGPKPGGVGNEDL